MSGSPVPVLNGPTARVVPASRRGPTLLLCLLAILWLVEAHDLAARAATGLAGRLLGGTAVPPLRAAFTLFLVLLGISTAQRLATRSSTPLAALLPLPQRNTARQEFALPAVLAWAAALLTVLPLALFGRLSTQLWLAPGAWLTLAANVLALALATLSIEFIFRGLCLPRLTAVLGPTAATTLVTLVYAVLLFTGQGGAAGLLNCLLFSLLLSTAWLRTHALWASWGLHFGWSFALGQLFGLPTFSPEDLSSVVQSRSLAQSFFLGHAAGPIGALWTSAVLLATLVALIRLTRDFAWQYTHPTLEPAGVAVTVAPPPAHTSFVPPPPAPSLIQILSPAPPPPPPPRPSGNSDTQP